MQRSQYFHEHSKVHCQQEVPLQRLPLRTTLNLGKFLITVNFVSSRLNFVNLLALIMKFVFRQCPRCGENFKIKGGWITRHTKSCNGPIRPPQGIQSNEKAKENRVSTTSGSRIFH